MKSKLLLANLAFLGLVLAVQTACGQHGHLNAGALGTNQNDQLYFANGSLFAASSGYVQTMSLSNSGTYAGYYNSGPSFTALPQTVANGGPVPNATAFGSFIQMRLESVTGPAGGTFSFWDTDATTPTISLAVGASSPSALWALSDAGLGAGQPGADPFGHLHGRRFTVDVEGDYTIGFRLFDTSTNGLAGAPIHAMSGVFLFNFQGVTVPEPSTLALLSAAASGLGWVARRRRRTAQGDQTPRS